jgi:hypothetical protein
MSSIRPASVDNENTLAGSERTTMTMGRSMLRGSFSLE